MVRTVLLLALAAASGCAAWRFDALRSAQFVNEEGVYVLVDYGREAHESEYVAPSGVRLPFKSNLKVRVTPPGGRSFVAYQVMSEAGVLYESDDGRWRYLEEGTGCALAVRREDGNGYALLFQGVLCAKLRPPDGDTRAGGWRKARK